MTQLSDEIIENAKEAMKLSRKFFVVELDYSEESLETLEGSIDDVDFALAGGRSEENVQLLRRVWGSYLGEVIRRQRGGEWVEATDDRGPAMQLGAAGATVYPFEQVQKRLIDGAARNLWEFYKSLGD